MYSVVYHIRMYLIPVIGLSVHHPIPVGPVNPVGTVGLVSALSVLVSSDIVVVVTIIIVSASVLVVTIDVNGP